MRRPIIAGNWKMNLGRVEQALAFVREIRPQLNQIEEVERVLCPPFTVLHALSEVLQPQKIGLGAQNMHWAENGAHTGEISPAMLQGICQYVILGHSERRAQGSNHDDNASINRKVQAALAYDLVPIICVGEDLTQNEAGATEKVVSAQVQAALAGLSAEQVKSCVIAYEPIWAIGTGKAATAVEANRIIGLIVRGTVADSFGEEVAQALRVQYGGSVNESNICEYMTMPEIDGALVGGASIKATFVELVRGAVPA